MHIRAILFHAYVLLRMRVVYRADSGTWRLTLTLAGTGMNRLWPPTGVWVQVYITGMRKKRVVHRRRIKTE